jgi:hypothetical protein
MPDQSKYFNKYRRGSGKDFNYQPNLKIFKDEKLQKQK